jgi:prepilin-type N-terminal cleavage/methylation domain-containing protein
MRHRRGRPTHSRGYTLAEILIVISIIGILAAISLPRLGTIRDRSEMASATTRFTRAVMAARQAAIQRGRRAYFRHNNNYIWVIVDTTALDSIVVSSPISLSELYGVTVTAPTGLSSIEYDPRGVATQPSAKIFRFLHRSSRVDSLCVSKLGNTIRAHCP